MKNLCKGCGKCCSLFLINLSKSEYESGEYKTMFEEYGVESFSKAKSSGANFLAKKKDGRCIYLKGDKCEIHANRPQVCRDFFCSSKAKKYKGMVEMVEKNNQK